MERYLLEHPFLLAMSGDSFNYQFVSDRECAPVSLNYKKE